MLKNIPLNVANQTLGTTGNDDQTTPLVTSEQVLDFSKLLAQVTTETKPVSSPLEETTNQQQALKQQPLDQAQVKDALAPKEVEVVPLASLTNAKTSAQLELEELGQKQATVEKQLPAATNNDQVKPVKVAVTIAGKQADLQPVDLGQKPTTQLREQPLAVQLVQPDLKLKPNLMAVKVKQSPTKISGQADEQVDLGQLALLTSAAFKENLAVANGQTNLKTNLPSQVQEISLTTGQTSELDSLANKIVAGLKSENLNDHKTLTLQIKPEKLGKMEVKFKATAENFTLEFKVETKETKAILEAVSDKLQKIIDKQLSPTFSQALNLQAPSEVLKVSPSQTASEMNLGQFDFDQGQSQQRQFGQTHQTKKASPKQAVTLVEDSPANPQVTGQVSILV
ncbi:flagellar hook-length control protein FliK [Ligilactobacillus agilis]|uniref:flagellar hook-length control protein FliK n=1 Tax=Ligilactobacillus agilis TaxID=1601 RepID=UPI0022E502AF|nr:flagellar hook-length control protein FliK [Ligilactobacillus agilis]